MKPKRIVFTNGCFDVLHAGHVQYLEAARKLGDFLIVGLNTDASVAALKGPLRPINCEEDRKTVLRGLRCVDDVETFFGTNCANLIRHVRPSVYVKGGDYTIDNLNSDELKALIECRARIVFIPLRDDLSSSKIIAKCRSLPTNSKRISAPSSTKTRRRSPTRTAARSSTASARR